MFYILSSFILLTIIFSEEIFLFKSCSNDLINKCTDLTSSSKLAICINNNNIEIPSITETNREENTQNFNLQTNMINLREGLAHNGPFVEINLQQNENFEPSNVLRDVISCDEENDHTSCFGTFCNGFILCFSFLFD